MGKDGPPWWVSDFTPNEQVEGSIPRQDSAQTIYGGDRSRVTVDGLRSAPAGFHADHLRRGIGPCLGVW